MAHDQVTDTSDDVADSTQTTLVMNRYPDDQGAGHIKTLASIVGAAEPRVVMDRDLAPHEERVLLDSIGLVRTLGFLDEQGVTEIGEAFSTFTEAIFVPFSAYCRGVISGDSAALALARAVDSIEALVKLYEADPLADMRKSYGTELPGL